jgi:hypothetical protein
MEIIMVYVVIIGLVVAIGLPVIVAITTPEDLDALD